MISLESHENRVEAWLKDAAKGLSSKQITDLVEAAIKALWDRIEFSINAVAIQAILDRALFIASERIPELRHLKVTEDGLDFTAIRAATLTEETLLAAYKCLVAEFISILGNLTANVFTEALYQELTQVKITARNKDKKNDE